jgi:hypothetical protein
MRGSLKSVLARVDRLAGRIQPSSQGEVDWDELVEVLKSARTEPAGYVAPELSNEDLAALWAGVKASRRR